MPSIMSALSKTSDALNVYSQALQVLQNNVANVATPAYARQSQELISMSFDGARGAMGGVRAGPLRSARNAYAEQSVREQTVQLGQDNQDVQSLSALQSNFDVTGKSGLAQALNTLFQAFSAWGQTPSDSTSRQAVLDGAGGVAQAFQQSAIGFERLTSDTEQQLGRTVAQVNQLAARLALSNERIQKGGHNDAGMDAQIHADLEELSAYVSIVAMPQDDGTTTVLMNGQTPLVIGARTYDIFYSLQESQDPAAPYPHAPPSAHIQAYDGVDVTAATTTGQLGSLLKMRNQLLPSYTGDAFQAGELNTMAKAFADRVNSVLAAGTLADGTTPGVALFVYGSADDPANDTNVARTLALNPAITKEQLAANVPGPPALSNGIPLALARLANPTDDANKVNGQSFAAFYGSMAARAGRALSDATNRQMVSQAALAQAQNLRQQASGVDLNEEAIKLVEFQRAYEANSRLITVLDQLTQEIVDILR